MVGPIAVSPLMMAVFFPAAAGNPSLRLTAAVTMPCRIGVTIGIGSKVLPQPSAFGTAKELSTRVPPSAIRICPAGSVVSRKDSAAGTPLIGVFGGGGLVVLATSFNRIGWLAEPI